ncbi:MAG: ABC transporter permease [Candidatus Palauibacterales bacterium]|nr:ABC transporter permease [Candidatus Palauibacterales bacterium]
MIDSLTQDMRQAGRLLLKNRGFAAVVILTLALGVGVNTAIFSVVNGVLLKPLAFSEPEQLVALGEGQLDGSPDELGSTSAASFFAWQEQATSFSGMGGWSSGQGTLTGRGEPQTLSYVGEVGVLFAVLGRAPLLGRTLVEGDEESDAELVVVLSYSSWQRLFGGDVGAIGQSLTLNGRPRTVVGVMPPDFRFPDGSVDVWLPYQFSGEFRANRDQYFLQAIARLRPGETVEGARAEMETIASRLRTEHALFNTDLRINVLPFRSTLVADVRTRLWVLMGAVGFLLLITCANLANLFLAKASGRREEIAVRNALGADRGRLVRQLLTESLVLSVAGGAAAVLVGFAVLKLLMATLPGGLPRTEEIGLDPLVLLFTLAIALVSGLAFGIVPALQLSKMGPGGALREGTRSSARRGWSRSALVVSEVALALMLLAGAGLLVRSFGLLQKVDPGLRTENLLTFSVAVGESRPEFFATSLERIESLPGVRSAAIVSRLPVSGRGVGAWFNIFSRPLPEGETPPAVPYRVISPGYFETAGIPLIRGRPLTAADRLDGQRSVVISESLAKNFWPDGDPIGEKIYLGAPDNRLFEDATIVGIVGDTKDAGLDSDPLLNIYVPHAMMPYWREFSFVIRTEAAPTAVARAARSEIRALDASLPITSMRTMEDVLGESVASARWSMMLLGSFAGIALALAALGVFGVLSYVVTQRTRELGIRIALGATSQQIEGMVVRQGMTVALLGVVLGLGGGLATTRLMSSMLYGITSSDPLTYGVVLTLLVSIAGLAVYLPARRATRVDPMLALRAE